MHVCEDLINSVNQKQRLFLPNSGIQIGYRKTDSWLFRKAKSQWVFDGIVMACVFVRWNGESLIVQWILQEFGESFFWRCMKNRVAYLDVFGSPFWHRAGMRCNDVFTDRHTFTEPSVLRVYGWFFQKTQSLWIVWRWIKNTLIFLDVFDRSFRQRWGMWCNAVMVLLQSILQVCG